MLTSVRNEEEKVHKDLYVDCLMLEIYTTRTPVFPFLDPYPPVSMKGKRTSKVVDKGRSVYGPHHIQLLLCWVSDRFCGRQAVRYCKYKF